jgi:diguanylate cyclase (GGDEF)-like protein
MLVQKQWRAKNSLATEPALMRHHLVQFYENDAFLVDYVTGFIGTGMAKGEKGLVIASRPHLQKFESALQRKGILAREQDRRRSAFIPLEAEKILPLLMINGSPDEARFIEVIGSAIRCAANDENGKEGRVRVFGEMVALLCGEEHCKTQLRGPYVAALKVERFFNILQQHRAFSLLCGYPISAFPREQDAAPFREICNLHDHVIPTESFNAETSIEQLQRTVAELQQKAFSLAIEVNERLQLEQALRDVNFDRLTGLPNRSVFMDRLETEIRKASRIRLPLALIFLDLDNFKEINDTLGHDLGDQLLVQVGQRICAHVREGDTVARLGGDEFTIILAQLHDLNGVTLAAQNILQNLENPFQLGSEVACITASIGITLYPDDADTAGELLRNADQAMYASKDHGRNRLTYFTRSMQEAAQARMLLTNELRGALAGNQLRILYQPIVDLDTGRIRKAEALLRWQHPVRGLISPDEFIPIAERTGLIDEIGTWVFCQAAMQSRRWRSHDKEFQISVNVSPAQFYKSTKNDLSWLKHWSQLNTPPDDGAPGLVVEITEGLLLDASSAVTNQLLAFRDAGIQVSLDDFGTGYSSLSYLRKFDIDYLKIDQSFVINLEREPDNLALCEAIIVMAHKLGLKVIAEGVETRCQSDILRDAGCDYAQGFLYSRPLPAAEFETLLKNK